MYPGRNYPPRRQNRRENVNESIRAREVRAVFPDGTTEIMPTTAALRKAQELLGSESGLVRVKDKMKVRQSQFTSKSSGKVNTVSRTPLKVR